MNGETEKIVYKWARFISGILMSTGMLYIHAFVMQLSAAWVSLPIILLGASPSDYVKNMLKGDKDK